MNAKQLKEQEVEECLERERTEREPRYPLMSDADIEWLTRATEPIDLEQFEATGVKPHWHDRKCWCGTKHYYE